MTQRQLLLGLIFLGGAVAFAAPAEAQRSGFIVGFGLGPGWASYGTIQDREPISGIAFDFHIGGVIGDSFELYYVRKGIFFDGEAVGEINGFGVGGIGFGYWLNPRFSINGAIGPGWWIDGSSGTTTTSEGLGGFSAGGRYLLSESGRWGLGFDLTYSKPFDNDVDFDALGVQFTFNVLSH